MAEAQEEERLFFFFFANVRKAKKKHRDTLEILSCLARIELVHSLTRSHRSLNGIEES